MPRGCSCPRLVARLGLGRGEPELCPLPPPLCHVSPAVEMPSSPPSRPITETHPKARLPRPAARLLAVMFADQDVCCLSQEALAAQGFGNSLRRVLRALVEAGFMSKQAGAARVPDTYRLQHRLGDAP